MDEATIRARIEEYQQEMESIRAQVEKIRREAEGKLNALQGAIDDCEHWIKQLEQKNE